jgi:uncharacterized alkaline shock family protein YloU
MATIPEGKITVAPEVLLEIIELAALYTDGVVRLASTPARVDRLFKKVISGNGIDLEIDQDSVTIDLYLIVKEVDILALSHKVQKEVIRSMDRIVGLNVNAVNVHIEDVEYPDNGTE